MGKSDSGPLRLGRRHNLSHRLEKTYYTNRLWVGCPRHGLYHACDPASFVVPDEISPSS